MPFSTSKRGIKNIRRVTGNYSKGFIVQNILESENSPSKGIQWITSITVIAFHLMAIWALFTFSWQNLIAALIVWWATNSWGIGMGYHRLLTHGGFKTPKLVEYFLTVCGTLDICRALKAGDNPSRPPNCSSPTRQSRRRLNSAS